jgi:large subunit GTPase 1
MVADLLERSKLRIIAGPGVSTPANNPFLLSAEEEKEVKAKQRDLRQALRVPRRSAGSVDPHVRG